MYTQCPKCETVFHITMEQLKAHEGVVRCGRCDNVFNADQQLFSDIPENLADKPAPRRRAHAEDAPKQKPAKPKAPRTAKKSSVSRRDTAAESAGIAEAIEAVPAPWTPPSETQTKARPRDNLDTDILDTLAPFSRNTPPRRFSALWLVGWVSLAVLLVAQCVYFYRDQLAAYPELRPYLDEMCTQLGCRVQPPYDANRIELVQPTSIAPHPRIANALRLRATLVNRAENVQAHPFMQVTLTDSAGRVVARRIFPPHQYLEQQSTSGTDMPPHLAVSALIDITNPDGKAVGYQIDFLAPPPN